MEQTLYLLSWDRQPAYINRITATSYNPLFIYNKGGAGDSTYICFAPQSGQMQKEADTRCTSAPTDYPAEACPSGGPNLVCLP